MEYNTGNLLQNRRVHGTVIIVLLALAAFLAIQTVNGIKAFQFIGADTPAQATITVGGEGEVFAVPDVARVTFSVVEKTETVAEAQGMATEKGNQAIAYLEENGIEERDIKTTDYIVRPVYEYVRGGVCTQGFCPPENRQLSGFEVRQTVQVKVRDTQQAGMLLAGLGEIGVSEISELNFTVEDDEALKREAREQAIAQAKEKAETLADDLGVDLVRIINFNESSNIPSLRYGFAEELGGSADTAVSTPDIPAGENKITSRVNITYEIR